jgi:hypothetical protein
MKTLLLFILLVTQQLQANASQKLFDLYQRGLYQQGCDYGYKFLPQYQHNESFISLVGFSCLKADQLEKLSPVVAALDETPESRANAAYFALLIMQKKLLMQALYDHKPLVGLKFPTSGHLLSKVFDLYLRNPKNGEMIKEYSDPINPRQSYRLYTTETNGEKRVAIDEYYDKILTFHHVY